MRLLSTSMARPTASSRSAWLRAVPCFFSKAVEVGLDDDAHAAPGRDRS